MSTMTEVRVSDATGQVLNWMVAKAIGGLVKSNAPGDPWPLTRDGIMLGVPDYSGDWAHGGPLIDHFDILFDRLPMTGDLVALMSDTYATGDTRLIAAGRVIVAVTLGEVVSVPTELLEVQP